MSQQEYNRSDGLLTLILVKVKRVVGKDLKTEDLQTVPTLAVEWLRDHDNCPFVPASDSSETVLNPELAKLLTGWL